jgi:hypothetical protein
VQDVLIRRAMRRSLPAVAATLAVLAGLLSCAPFPSPDAGPDVLDGGGPVHRLQSDAGSDAGNDLGARGSIAGQVTLYGAVSSAGVKVSLQPLGVSTLTSDPSGDFLIEGVPPGPFTLTFTDQGYAEVTLSDVLQSGDAAFEWAHLQRSVVLSIFDAGTIDWIGGPAGPPRADAGGARMYAVGNETIHILDLGEGSAQPLLASDAPIEPLGVSSNGVGFFLTGSKEAARLVVAGRDLSVIDVPELVPRTAQLVGERLFFALEPDGGWLQNWASVADGDLFACPELDNLSPVPAPVIFGDGLAGYREQDVGCEQLMAFGGAAFSTLSDCIPFQASQLDSSLDGQLVTRVRSPKGRQADSFLDIVGGDGGIAEFDRSFVDSIYAHAIPLDERTLYLVDPWGAISVWTLPDSLLYSAATLGQAPRPGGSFLAVIADDAGTSSNLVTDNGVTTLPFGVPWSMPTFSPDGRYAVFAGLPALFDLVRASEYALIIDPDKAAFSAVSDEALLLGADGTLAVIDLTALPNLASDAPGQGPDVTRPVGTKLEGVAVTAAVLTPDGASVVYAGVDPAGRLGIFLEPTR